MCCTLQVHVRSAVQLKQLKLAAAATAAAADNDDDDRYPDGPETPPKAASRAKTTSHDSSATVLRSGYLLKKKHDAGPKLMVRCGSQLCDSSPAYTRAPLPCSSPLGEGNGRLWV